MDFRRYERYPLMRVLLRLLSDQPPQVVPKNLTSSSGLKNAIFRVFNPKDFIPYQSWRRLESILCNNTGGAFGIGGPRGSGKTWLIQKSAGWARENQGVGLWFPTPSDYGAEPFLTALANNFASEVQRQFSTGAPRWYSRFASKWLILAIIIVMGLFIYFQVTPRISLPAELQHSWHSEHDILNFLAELQSTIQSGSLQAWPIVVAALVLLVWILLIIVLIAAVVGVVAQQQVPGYLYKKATEFKQWLRYSETLKSNQEAYVKVGQKASWGITRQAEKSLAERALTVASLVYEFRNFMEQIAQFVAGPIVIGIDELDKISDTEKAKQLLRDIKGIFEVDRVHFLVSISNEAKRTLNLGSLQERDEFNSSFFAVVDVLPNDPSECANLVAKRCPDVFDERSRRVIGILGGGNLREVVRLADICSATRLTDASSTSITEWLASIISEEARTIRIEVLGAALPEYLKLNAYTNLDESRFTVESLANEANQLPSGQELLNSGKDNDVDARQRETVDQFIQLWSKFRLRYQIAQQLVRCPEIADNTAWAVELQRIVINLSSSTVVAENLLNGLISRMYPKNPLPAIPEGEQD